MTNEQVMQQALGALEVLGYGESYAAIDLREALAEQAEQEPVAYLCPSFVDNYATGRYETCGKKDYGAFPTYAAPVRTKDLTDDEIETAKHCLPRYLAEITDEDLNEFARAVIAADREKNK